MDAKATSIVAYFGWIGFLISYLAGDREGAKFHLNQALVLNIFSLIGVVIGRLDIPLIGWIITSVWSIATLVFWIIGLVAAIQQEEKEIPIIGSIHLL